MVRESYVKGTSFVGVSSSESEDSVMKDVKERLTCPHRGTLSTERLTCPLPRNTEHVSHCLSAESATITLVRTLACLVAMLAFTHHATRGDQQTRELG